MNNDIDRQYPFYVMFCEKNSYSMISIGDIDHVKQIGDFVPTWYRLSNGYIGTHIQEKNDANRDTVLYLHAHILSKHTPQPDETFSVDHINHNKLDNRVENLRWSSQSEQNKNTDKRRRKYNARPLPEGISELPKYVVYYKETYNKEHDKTREFFKIESHPVLGSKVWMSTKSGKVPITEKLNQTIQKLEELKTLCNN
jgi:hypothetical protein